MLVIRATSFKGRPVDRDLAAEFGEAGGTVGRGADSTLLLPDPDRHISRTHATISFQAGGFIVTDHGTKNPLYLNDRPMGPGIQARLAHGDRIKLGEYTLEVVLAPDRVPQPATPRIPDPFADLVPPKVEQPEARPWPRATGRPEPAMPLPPDALDAPVHRSSAPDPLAGLGGREPSIDDLLRPKSPGGSDLLVPEPARNRAFLPPAEPRPVDPLDFLGGSPRAAAPASVPDHGQEIFTPFVPPVAKTDPPAREPGLEPAPPSSGRPRAEPPPAPASRPLDSTGEALVRAFLEGAGIGEAQLPKGLTPEAMEAVGRLFREAVQGTLDLLRIRAVTKNEMRTEITAVTPADNNPLKFSPTVESALAHLLAPQGKGFLSPLRAMQEAYADLRAHELGFLAGMRAALDDVLARFAPEALERRLSSPSALDSLLPINRKAKQWDLFVEHYERVAGEAREDFNAAFGAAFRRAYETQVKKLRAEGRRS